MSKNKGMTAAIAVPQSEEQWRIKEACDTLMRAEEIKADPKLMAKIRKEMEHRQKAMNKAARNIGVAERMYKQHSADME